MTEHPRPSTATASGMRRGQGWATAFPSTGASQYGENRLPQRRAIACSHPPRGVAASSAAWGWQIRPGRRRASTVGPYPGPSPRPPALRLPPSVVHAIALGLGGRWFRPGCHLVGVAIGVGIGIERGHRRPRYPCRDAHETTPIPMPTPIPMVQLAKLGLLPGNLDR